MAKRITKGFYYEAKYDDGSVFRFNKKGRLHNSLDLAVIHSDGTQKYYVNGQCHRTDGPAVIRPNGTVEYWVNDKELSEEEFNKKYDKKGSKRGSKRGSKKGREEKGFDREKIDENGTIYRFNKKGMMHNTQGPAVVFLNGRMTYYLNGKIHRKDGPAVIWANGLLEYCVNGRYLPEEEFFKKYGPSGYNMKTVNDWWTTRSMKERCKIYKTYRVK